MERKIGEIFEVEGQWYQCVQGNCEVCDFSRDEHTCLLGVSNCVKCRKNNDCKAVAFKKLEKVGEPYNFQKKTFQTYKIFTTPFFSEDTELMAIPSKDNTTIEIEIKQNKEDMEEKNLKPFDLQKAREGKSVCTRDGCKARIICFDFRDADEICCIIAAVDYGEAEKIHYYDLYGKYRGGDSSEHDLMMLPEKKEGWVNVLKDYDRRLLDSTVYPSPEEARRNGEGNRNHIATVRIEWEE